MLLSFTTGLVGILVFLFIFWKRLKEDYASAMIFATSFYVILGIIAGQIIAGKFFPVWWFWFDLLGICLGLVFGILRFKLRIFETLEASVISLLPWLSLVFLKDSIKNSIMVSFFAFLVITFLIFLFMIFDRHYKKFTWYKSGRIGFSGLTTLGMFFLVRALVAATFSNMISFVGETDAIFSGVLAFLSFLAVFTLARETT